MKPVRFHPDAESEMNDAAAYYEMQQMEDQIERTPDLRGYRRSAPQPQGRRFANRAR